MEGSAFALLPLTWRLDLGDILQQFLALVDDVEGQVVHRKGLVCVVLQPLLSHRQVLGVEVTHLLRKLLIPWIQVWDDLRRRRIAQALRFNEAACMSYLTSCKSHTARSASWAVKEQNHFGVHVGSRQNEFLEHGLTQFDRCHADSVSKRWCTAGGAAAERLLTTVFACKGWITIAGAPPAWHQLAPSLTADYLSAVLSAPSLWAQPNCCSQAKLNNH